MNTVQNAGSTCRPQKIEGKNQLNKTSNRAAKARREKIKRKTTISELGIPITEVAKLFIAIIEHKDRRIMDEVFNILQRRWAEEVDAHATVDALSASFFNGNGAALYKAIALCHGKPLGGKHGSRAAKNEARNKGGIK